MASPPSRRWRFGMGKADSRSEPKNFAVYVKNMPKVNFHINFLTFSAASRISKRQKKPKNVIFSCQIRLHAHRYVREKLLNL